MNIYDVAHNYYTDQINKNASGETLETVRGQMMVSIGKRAGALGVNADTRDLLPPSILYPLPETLKYRAESENSNRASTISAAHALCGNTLQFLITQMK